MGIQVVKAGFSAKTVANKYDKIWEKKGLDYNNKNKYVLFWVTKEMGLNGLYVYRYSTGYVKKL